MSAPGGLHVFAGYGLDVVMGVTLLLPKRFPLGGDSQGMVMYPVLGGVLMGGAVSGLGIPSWKSGPTGLLLESSET